MSEEPVIKKQKKEDESKKDYIEDWLSGSSHSFKKLSPMKRREDEWNLSDIQSFASSYSSFDQQKMKEELGVTFEVLKRNCKTAYEFSELVIELLNLNLTKSEYDILNLKDESKQNLVLDQIYENLIKKFRLYEYPKDNFELNEYYLQDLVAVFLEAILINFKDDLEDKNLIVRREGNLKSIKLMANKKATSGRIEFIIKISKEIIRDDDDDFYKIKTLKSNLLVVEVKKDDLKKGQAQCLIALRDAYDSNTEKRLVFGIVTNVETWIFILYNGTQFLLSEEIENVIDKDMKNNKNKWLQGNSKSIYNLFYIIYCTSLVTKWNITKPPKKLAFKPINLI